jgi:hypothetical protein
MKIDRVKATIRYSQDTSKGAWKSIEIGAEGSVDERERWDAALAHLYADLGQQLKGLWANGQKSAAEPPAVGDGKAEPPAHFCQEHQAEYKRFEKDGRIWYSHKALDGKWCKDG